MKSSRRPRPPVWMPSGLAGLRFPPEVILLAVRWYLRYGLSYRDLEEFLAERGIEVDHVTLYRWVQRVHEFGGLDILVNNAGMGDIKPIEETTLADWDRTVQGGRA